MDGSHTLGDASNYLLEDANYWTENAGKRVAIDSSVWLHNMCKNKKYVIEYVVNGNLDGVLSLVKSRLQRFFDEGVTPVFVFDGEDLRRPACANRAIMRVSPRC